MPSKRKDTIIQLLTILGFFLYFDTAWSVCFNPAMQPLFTKLNFSLVCFTPLYGVGLSYSLASRARNKYLSHRIYITSVIFILTSIALTLVSVIGFLLFINSYHK